MSAPGAEPSGPTAVRVRPLIVVLAAGIFVTGFGWPGTIGRLPFSLLLKNQLHMPAFKISAFWAIATIPWYLKPLFGLISDAYPLFGTRRRGYLLTGTIVAGIFWLAFTIVPRAYFPLLALSTLLNSAMAFVATVVGGFQIEIGQRYGATGRLASLREGLDGVMALGAGPVGGLLAVCAFGWTGLTGAFILLSFVPVVALLFPEPRGARPDEKVWAAARHQLKVIVRSRTMWSAAGLMFLVLLAPGFQAPVLFYQTDVLKLDPRFIGILEMLGGAGMLAGAAAYGFLCRRVSLRLLLVTGIALNAGSTLLYLRYDTAFLAAIIDTTAGLVGTMAILPLYDLAARSIPAGNESFGFALMMSVRNIAIFGISNPLGSKLYDDFHMGFKQLVWLNAGSTAVVLLFVPLLPAALLAAREQPRLA